MIAGQPQATKQVFMSEIRQTLRLEGNMMWEANSNPFLERINQ